MGRGTGIGKKDFWILLSGKNKKKGQDTVTSCVCHICLVRLLCLEAGVGEVVWGMSAASLGRGGSSSSRSSPLLVALIAVLPAFGRVHSATLLL